MKIAPETLTAFWSMPELDRRLCKEFLDRLEGFWGEMSYEREMDWHLRVLSAMFRNSPFPMLFERDWRLAYDALPGKETDLDGKERSTAVEAAFRNFHHDFE